MKHPIYTEKSNISFEKYEPNNDSSCSINCCSRSINDGICCTRTTRIGMGRFFGSGFIGTAVASAVEEDSWRFTAVVLTALALEEDSFVHKTIIQTIHQVN